MFYHDHAWGITRLNVYAGEAAPYLITDADRAEAHDTGRIPGPAGHDPAGHPGQDLRARTQLYDDPARLRPGPDLGPGRWGGYGSLWYHHVYMPAQNPGDPSGMSAFGRWMYGPWFWPPARTPSTGHRQPVLRPDLQPRRPGDLAVPDRPVLRARLIPGTPNISAGMEQFNDTPLVNGVAYPTITVEPKTYRFRILNAANDRFFNLQWYVGDPSTASTALTTS